MKKNIGLFADLKNFNTTLPQTKHLNYIMSTNPVGYANGGDVRAGVPSSNMNVTKGFLPMALGFDNGGEADKSNFLDESKLTFQAIINIIAEKIVQMEDFLGMSPNDPKVQEEAEKILNENPGMLETINDQQKRESQQFSYQGELTPKEPRTPVDTFKEPPSEIPNAPGGSLPQGDGGIANIQVQDPTTMLPQAPNMNMNPSIFDKPKEFFKEDVPEFYEDKVVPFYEDKVVPFFNPPSEIPNAPGGSLPQVEEKDVIVPETDDGGISTIPTLPATEGSLVGSNKDLTIPSGKKVTEKESKDINDAIKTVTGNDKGKDVPKWAIPLMSAGFGMMASKSPYFLQALGEGGQEGIKSLVGMQESERAQKLEEAQIKSYEAQAEKNRRGTSKVKIITDDQGRSVYATFNPAADEKFKIMTQDDGTPVFATRSRSEIAQAILKSQPYITEEELTNQVDMVINQELNIAKGNVTNTIEKDDGPGFFDKILGGIKEGLTS